MQLELIPIERHIAPMKDDAIARVREVEKQMLAVDQLDIPTEHVIHGGMYARTIFMPAGTLLTGALIKVPTLFIIQGDAEVYMGDGSVSLSGYNTFTASPNRKQLVLSVSDVFITMVLASDAKDVDAAEKQFTDEHEMLGSHRESSFNRTLITGE